MKISYNWLKQYVNIEETPEQLSVILTDIGLEVEGVELIETIKGGLKGVVIGEVLSKEKHPDADRLNVTTVNVGAEENLQIVCGAPNVDAGQKVVVATVGCKLYPSGNEEGFKIKKSKIRGVESFGMICAEDEIGLGKSHDGIMVLDADAKVGTEAQEFFNLENDYLIEIGLTPNRADAMSHIGVARDLQAYYNYVNNSEKIICLPNVDKFKVDNTNATVNIRVEDIERCPRYAGISITGVKIAPSPDWIQNRLRSIGLSPINNVADITNFVLHELGQPLHAFDADVVNGNVVVRTAKDKEKFTTLDEVERELSTEDLMICNDKDAMCIAGVFGGIESGISDKTTNVFLESAYFNPVSVRKSAKRQGLNTDASFRFERGIDPNFTIYALKRAALLIQEIAGGEISSEITDLYPNRIEDFKVDFSIQKCHDLLGEEIPKDKIELIFKVLDINIDSEKDGNYVLNVPAFRVDVQREADIVEEILRIYGYNNIYIPNKVNSSLAYAPKPDKQKVQNLISDLLTSNGFAEIMSNSLTSSKYVDIAKANHIKDEFNVRMLNPLSVDLDVMRQTLLFSGLESVTRNQNRKNTDLKLYEFGKTYQKFNDGEYNETEFLSIFLTGSKEGDNWYNSNEKVNFYSAKGTLEQVLGRLGILKNYNVRPVKNELFEDGLQYTIAKKKVADIGWIRKDILKKTDIKSDVYYIEINWNVVVELLKMNKVKYKELAKFPAVKRDLSLLLNKSTKFEEIAQIAKDCDKRLLKEVSLFDVYQGKNLAEDKKSYAVTFILQDEEKTMNDKVINKVMDKIQSSLITKLGAELR